jgi:hypothetical protein
MRKTFKPRNCVSPLRHDQAGLHRQGAVVAIGSHSDFETVNKWRIRVNMFFSSELATSGLN